MDSFSFLKSKYSIFILIIFILFIILIVHAFSYIQPVEKNAPQTQNSYVENEDNRVENENEINDYRRQEDSYRHERERARQEYDPELRRRLERKAGIVREPEQEKYSSKHELPALEPIDAPPSHTETSRVEKTYDNVMANAYRMRRTGDLTGAFEEYKKALEMAEESYQKADCYEAIATLYAINRRYGSAISSAQRANNISPSASREILLARLYYLTGEKEKAQRKIESVLGRDFAQDK